MRRRLPTKLIALVMMVVIVAAPFVATGTKPALQQSLMTIDTDKRSSTTNNTAGSSGSGSFNFKSSEKYPYSSVRSTIKKYQDTNSDVKGWLVVPNTNISKPIIHYKNNSYYLYRTWDGVNYPNTTYLNFQDTAIYADYRTVFGNSWKQTSKNIVLYGHNWTNLRNPLAIGSNNNHIMFGQLPSYTNQEFAQNNPYIYFSTDDVEGVWKVFAVAYAEESKNFFYNQPNPTTEAYQKILDEWKLRTLYDFGVDVTTDDRILTLSTCSRVYNAGALQRYVVVARLLRDGESESDPVTVKANPNPKQPSFS